MLERTIRNWEKDAAAASFRQQDGGLLPRQTQAGPQQQQHLLSSQLQSSTTNSGAISNPHQTKVTSNDLNMPNSKSSNSSYMKRAFGNIDYRGKTSIYSRDGKKR